MEQLSYETLKKIGYKGYLKKEAPEKVMQFGEGNFLRAFVDYWFDVSNEKADWNGKCALVQPIEQGLAELINSQEGLYTLYLRGSEDGKRIDNKRLISSVSRCINPYTESGFNELIALAKSDELEYIVSNTTEAGIAYDPACLIDDRPCSSFPGKLTQVLYARFCAGKSGLVILSCELIDNNGAELLTCVNKYISQWELPEAFSEYVNEKCVFCTTLVDRIVPGRIKDEKEIRSLEDANGYKDKLIDVGEIFGVWNIEGPRWLSEKLPFERAGVNCHVSDDVTPYKKRKVRILNVAHTGFVLGAYLAGFEIVRECMENDTVRGYMNKMLYDEVIPTLTDVLDEENLKEFAGSVQDRFNNPFVDHELMSISLNSTSKWRARIMPSFFDYIDRTGQLPKCITTSFAAYIAFYTSEVSGISENGLVCRRPDGKEYVCSDDDWVLSFYYAHRNDSEEKLVHDVMTNERMWGRDLTAVDGFEDEVTRILKKIRKDGALSAFSECL